MKSMPPPVVVRLRLAEKGAAPGIRCIHPHAGRKRLTAPKSQSEHLSLSSASRLQSQLRPGKESDLSRWVHSRKLSWQKFSSMAHGYGHRFLKASR